jgi:hypothetical protein
MVAVLLATTAVVYAPRQVETFTVLPGRTTMWKINLDDKDYVNCSFGDEEIYFYVTDPYGVTILDLGLVSGFKYIEFTAQGSGEYTLHFENRFTWVDHGPSVMTMVLNTPAKGIPIWVVLILFVVAAVIGIGIYAFRKRNRNKPSKLIANAEANVQPRDEDGKPSTK